MKRQEEQKVMSALSNLYPKQQNGVEFIQSRSNEPETNRKQSAGEEELLKKHQQYLEDKLEWKKEFQKRKRQIFGASSSEEDDIGGSESDSDSGRRKSTLQEEAKFRESQKLKEISSTGKQQKCQIFFSIKKIKQNWSEESLNFEQQSLIISEKLYFLKEFHKIKLMQGIAGFIASRIKLSTIDENQLFIGASCKVYQQLPQNYFIFAYIVQQKLINMGRKLFKCSSPNVPGIPETLVKNSYNYGKIFKKSQILGKWEERLIVINRQGIFSYKKFNEKHSMFIAGSSVKQLWTRFEIQQGQGLLVIKILHSSSTKTEFGLPLSELLDKKSWLYSFYLLMFPQ